MSAVIMLMLYYLSIGVASYADEAKQSSALTRQRLLALEKRLPETIGYGDGNSVTVINAFGNPMTFPLELCLSPDVRFFCITFRLIFLRGGYRNSMIP
jgi:hypothetical protein